ncbi:hypothetical protein [Flavobacterium gelatinilyticum]|uniref:hypothetical protein n=1 Tax=Flavobacterium gelatinilyticum TaxID=3003260 RepID=UPI00248042CA|nr:hypothetical protein [Flavobacterium gelatinilyticum]
MKKLVIAALLFAGIAGFAQDKKEKLTPEERTEKQLQRLTSELNLDANQQAQIKQLLAEKSAKTEKIRKERKENKTKLTQAEREAFKNELKAQKEAVDAKMKSILNADQYTKWHSLQEKNKDKAKEKMKEYQEKNN